MLFAAVSVQAQNSIPETNPGVLAKLAPEQEQICTFEPTYRDVFYYKGAEEFRNKGSIRAKTATFQVNYVGNWPQQAREAFEYAISIWEFHISSNIPIRIEANWTELQGSTLGSAGPTLIYPIDGAWYPIAQASAVTGEDLLSGNEFGEANDIVVNMNSSFDSWYYQTDANTPSGFIDFVTVVIHEIGHGLGFTGSMSGDPDTEIAEWGLGDDPILPFVYDTFIEDGFTQPVLNENVYPNPSNALYGAVTGNSNGLFFIGDQANEAYEDLPVPIYAPPTWQGGSSFSHLDLATFTNTENALMRPQIDNAFAIHSPGPVMCGIFADKGWPLGGGCAALLGSQSQIAIDNIEFDFGITNVGTEIEETIIITNLDRENSLVGQVEVSSGQSTYSLDEDVIFLNIDPGADLEIPITFLPRFANELNGEIRIAHNAVNQSSPVTISLTGEALEKDKVVELSPNYPNPFNARTNIPYSLPQDSYVRLEIFDMLGKKVQTVVNGNRQRGRYVEQINANELSSGVYIYRILVDGTPETGKFILAK